jgi:two-component system cell cycle response regulator DivK
MATILVIDDNPTDVKLAVLLLERGGHSVIVAADAEAGLSLARDKQPDLILMDIQLPGMNGVAAVTLLKRDSATRAIPVVALTALAMKSDEERLLGSGCNGYIAKPLAYANFMAVIAAHLLPVASL